MVELSRGAARATDHGSSRARPPSPARHEARLSGASGSPSMRTALRSSVLIEIRRSWLKIPLSPGFLGYDERGSKRGEAGQTRSGYVEA